MPGAGNVACLRKAQACGSCPRVTASMAYLVWMGITLLALPRISAKLGKRTS
jgi:hypothetical protein